MQSKHPAASQFSLVVIDDETLVREGLESLFGALPAATMLATGHDHATVLEVLPPPGRAVGRIVAVVDVGAGGIGLPEVVRLWSSQRPDARLVLVDEWVRDYHVRQAVKLRVSYVTKRDRFSDVADVIHRAADGVQSFSTEARKRVMDGPHGWELRPHKGPPGLHFLTPRETEILMHLAEGLSVRQCSEHLKISLSTVDNHKARIMKKLGFHKLIELVRFAMREGLVSR